MHRNFNFVLLLLRPPRNEEVVGRTSFPMQFSPINNAALPQEYLFFPKMVSLICLWFNMQHDTNYKEHENYLELKLLKSKPRMKAAAALSSMPQWQSALMQSSEILHIVRKQTASVSTEKEQVLVMIHCGTSKI